MLLIISPIKNVLFLLSLVVHEDANRTIGLRIFVAHFSGWSPVFLDVVQKPVTLLGERCILLVKRHGVELMYQPSHLFVTLL